MSGVVLIISIPTEENEKHLLKKIKKKVTIEEKPEILTSSKNYNKIKHDNTKETRSNGITKEESDLLENKEYQSMEKIIKDILEQMEIVDTTWTKTQDNNHYQVIFPIECGNKCEEMLEILKENDIGSKLNSKISVMPCTIHYRGNEVKENDDSDDEEDLLNEKDNHSGWNIFVNSVKSRLTVAQVVENVKAKAAMTFDFIMLLLISTTLCALGLVENNNIYMLSSMLISPMMGPVMAGTFGSIVRDKYLQKVGVQNELIGLSIATLVGFCYGSIICLTTDKYGTQDWPTYEMYSRGELRSLWVGALIALLSGAAVALGILSDNIASLVGVAISTSLMPPAVNAGLLWSLGLVYYLKSDESTRYASLTHTDYYSTNSALELSALGGVSICLTFVNIVCIYFAALIVFKIKEVAPNTTRDQARRKFWKHDIKIARNYNMSIQSGESNAYHSIMEQIEANQRAKDFQHYSTDLSKDNFKVKVKRREYTWSPCLKEAYDNYNSLLSGKLGQSTCKFASALLKKNNKTETEGRQRRLSQIFSKPPTKDDKVKLDIEKTIDETTPLIPPQRSASSTYLLSSGKKFVVTPCEI